VARAETVRRGKLGNKELRLVRRDGSFFALIDGRGIVKGEVAQDLWQRLHDEAGKANPKYFGFDGARARFLRFFPNGFHSAGYAGQERDCKVEAKAAICRVTVAPSRNW
jgi:hypothetical protein